MKKLYLSRNDKKLLGVCGGIAKYFEIDSTFIRIGFVLLALLDSRSLLVYIIMGLVIPNEIDNLK